VRARFTALGACGSRGTVVVWLTAWWLGDRRSLARNRESARQSRLRKKQHLELLEEKVSQLTTELDELARAHLARAETELRVNMRRLLESCEDIANQVRPPDPSLSACDVYPPDDLSVCSPLRTRPTNDWLAPSRLCGRSLAQTARYTGRAVAKRASCSSHQAP